MGILIGLLAAGLLIFDNANKKANQFLAALALVSTGSLFHNFLIETGIYNQYQSLYFLPVIFSLAVGPLLYLYVNRLININSISRTSFALHLAPAAIQALLYWWCFLQTNEEKYNIYISIYEPFAKPLQNLLVYVSVALYLYLAFKEIRNYKDKLNNFYSNDSLVALRWLRKLLYIFMLYYISLISFLLVSYSFKFSADYFPSDLIRCLILFTIAFFAVKQNSLIEMQKNIGSVEKELLVPESFQTIHQPQIEAFEERNSSEKTKDAANIIKPREVNQDLLEKIIALVEKEELYLNEELTINDLSVKLGYSSRVISHTINGGLQKSFSRFINEYRVNLFQVRRATEQFANLSIMGLAYDCGFNSKSTFNRIYKEITGGLPKDHHLTK
jgi:AraC-like DNA-binding protein